MSFDNCSYERAAKLSATLLVCFALIAPSLSKEINKIAFSLTVLGGGFIYLLAFLRRVKLPRKTFEEKCFIYVCLGYLIYVLLNTLIQGDLFHSDGKTDLFAYLFAPMFLAPLLYISKTNTRHLLLSLCIITIVSGIAAVYEYYMTRDRVGFMFHGQPIPFGNLALCTSFSCLALLRTENATSINLLLTLSSLCGIAASILSQTRGGWIAIPLFILILVVFNRKFFIRRVIISPLIASIVILIAVFITSGLSEKISNRVNHAVENASSYYNNSNKETSTGIRLSLWNIGIQGWQEAPVFGKGITEFYNYKNAQIALGNQPDYLQRFKHPHNEYIEILFTQGSVGLVLFFLFIFSLTYYYLKRATRSGEALVGLIITCGYLVCSLTESFYTLHTSLCFYLIINTVLLYILSRPADSNVRIANAT